MRAVSSIGSQVLPPCIPTRFLDIMATVMWAWEIQTKVNARTESEMCNEWAISCHLDCEQAIGPQICRGLSNKHSSFFSCFWAPLRPDAWSDQNTIDPQASGRMYSCSLPMAMQVRQAWPRNCQGEKVHVGSESLWPEPQKRVSHVMHESSQRVLLWNPKKTKEAMTPAGPRNRNKSTLSGDTVVPAEQVHRRTAQCCQNTVGISSRFYPFPRDRRMHFQQEENSSHLQFLRLSS